MQSYSSLVAGSDLYLLIGFGWFPECLFLCYQFLANQTRSRWNPMGFVVLVPDLSVPWFQTVHAPLFLSKNKVSLPHYQLDWIIHSSEFANSIGLSQFQHSICLIIAHFLSTWASINIVWRIVHIQIKWKLFLADGRIESFWRDRPRHHLQ